PVIPHERTEEGGVHHYKRATVSLVAGIEAYSISLLWGTSKKAQEPPLQPRVQQLPAVDQLVQEGLGARGLHRLDVLHTVAVAADQFVPAPVDELFRLLLHPWAISPRQRDEVQLEEHAPVLQLLHFLRVRVPERIALGVRQHGPPALRLHAENDVHHHRRFAG